jgi:hypothetical protein
MLNISARSIFLLADGERRALVSPKGNGPGVRRAGQKTSSHGVLASSGIVGDHNLLRPVASRRFQRSTTSSASMRAAPEELRRQP